MTDAQKDKLVQEVIEAFQKYENAFSSDDIETFNKMVSYPVAFIREGIVSMHDEFPVRASVLREQTGLHDTVNVAYEVVGISETKAHLILKSYTRVRQDGSTIENIHAFYAWTKTSEGWKVFAISPIRIPA